MLARSSCILNYPCFSLLCGVSDVRHRAQTVRDRPPSARPRAAPRPRGPWRTPSRSPGPAWRPLPPPKGQAMTRAPAGALWYSVDGGRAVRCTLKAGA